MNFHCAYHWFWSTSQKLLPFFFFLQTSVIKWTKYMCYKMFHTLKYYKGNKMQKVIKVCSKWVHHIYISIKYPGCLTRDYLNYQPCCLLASSMFNKTNSGTCSSAAGSIMLKNLLHCRLAWGCYNWYNSLVSPRVDPTSMILWV